MSFFCVFEMQLEHLAISHILITKNKNYFANTYIVFIFHILDVHG